MQLNITYALKELNLYSLVYFSYFQILLNNELIFKELSIQIKFFYPKDVS